MQGIQSLCPDTPSEVKRKLFSVSTLSVSDECVWFLVIQVGVPSDCDQCAKGPGQPTVMQAAAVQIAFRETFIQADPCDRQSSVMMWQLCGALYARTSCYSQVGPVPLGTCLPSGWATTPPPPPNPRRTHWTGLLEMRSATRLCLNLLSSRVTFLQNFTT